MLTAHRGIGSRSWVTNHPAGRRRAAVGEGACTERQEGEEAVAPWAMAVAAGQFDNCGYTRRVPSEGVRKKKFLAETFPNMLF